MQNNYYRKQLCTLPCVEGILCENHENYFCCTLWQVWSDIPNTALSFVRCIACTLPPQSTQGYDRDCWMMALGEFSTFICVSGKINTSLVPRGSPPFPLVRISQCTMLKNGRAWELKSRDCAYVTISFFLYSKYETINELYKCTYI